MRNRLHHVVTKLRYAAAASTVALLVAPAALAQGTGGPDLGLGYATAIGLTTTDIRTTIARIISYFLGFLGILVVGIMLYAGFLWMTAGGNEEKVSTAKKWMLNGTIGLVIVMSAFAITQFIFRAVEEGTGTGSGGGCPPGQICSPGGFGGGGSGGFRIEGTAPAGAGPGNGGWPKNYAITVSFNADVAEASVTPSSVEVRKCNARLDGGGDPAPFSFSTCTDPVAGTLTTDGNKVRFRPSGTPGTEPTDFEGDFWYKIRVQGGAVRDLGARTLLCPFQTVDISSSGAGSDYCERAIAFNNLRDVEPPTVAVNAPSSPPAYCASALVRTAQVSATGNDDFLVSGIDFLLDGGVAGLQDGIGDPDSSVANGMLVNPFTADTLYVNLDGLSAGPHRVSAVAQDGVPQSSSAVEREFSVNPPHCCNGTQDAGDGETGLDCGGACGGCNGSSCTENSQCASGFCNSSTGQCEPRPVIQAISPMTGGVGTMVTISGTSFGTSPGGIAFLGADTDGNGNPEGDADDVAAVACAPQAWTDTQVTVAVPVGAVSGPIKLVTSAGPSDRTDDDFGPGLGNFSVGGPTPPGICYLSPSEGGAGLKFAINGTGFGATVGTSQAFIGSNTLTVATCGAGETDCGWSDTRVWATVPPIAENVYNVRLVVNGTSTNNRSFLVRSFAAGQPRVTGVIPESGPVGSYVTIQGSNFGNIKGTVRFKFGADTAIAADPVCDNNWHDNYIIVKVPPEYEGSLPLNVSSGGVSHKVQVVTAPPAKTSNDDVTFRATNEAPRPGVCAITPDNGPPGNAVIVQGEGFGAGPGSAVDNPRFSVEFFKTQAKRCLFNAGTSCSVIGALCTNPSHGICVYNGVSSTGYSSWSGIQIGTIVAGETVKHCSINTAVLCTEAGLPCSNPTHGTCVADRSGWPATGPVFVVANNQLSSNAIPFKIQDCTESGASCPNGQTCCANGSCQASCLPVARNSAYGWRFSTNVLPTLPIVVERAVCSATSLPPTMQSPSPAKSSTDACKNTQIFVEFNRSLDSTTFNSSTVKVDECGDASQPDCNATVPLDPFSSPGTFSTCDSLEPTHCRTFQTRPANSYNGGTHYFKKNFWYRVTLVSNPSGGLGLREPGAEGRYLDGDLDRRQGGDYVYDFRIRNSDDPCQVSNVIVIAPTATIQQDQDPVNFNSGLLGGNCNLLQCGPGEPYAISWTANASYLNRLATLNAACTQPIRGVAETPTGAPTPLTAEVTPTPIGSAPPKSGTAAVTVKFADPRVVEVTPIAGCTQACVNAAIMATFNVPMDPATITGSTVEIKRCRNASCTAPYESDLGGGITASIQALPTDGTAPDGITLLHKHVTIVLSGNMQPGTFYLARIRGGASGVKSRSGVPLTGLNDGLYYAWKFRTKDDPTACSVARTSLAPRSAALRYVGERQDFTATPYGSPDECSAVGQQLRATAYNWVWDFDAPAANPVLQGFIDGTAPFTPLATLAGPPPTGTVVDTMPIPATGCTSSCILTGSQNALPQCGNGVVETQFESCDDGNTVDNDACTNQCVLRGNIAPSCGDHAADAAAGEQCDMIADTANPGSFVWPNGCKQPGVHVDGFADNIGCIFTGSPTATGSTCGDSFVSDGEACDDGNSENGDGCSAECLKEGSLRSCVGVAPGQACRNFCGNGIDEPGEDPQCDPNPAGNGCDTTTCLRVGTAHCPTPGAGSNCCGNNVVDAGEDAACETDPERAEFCTSRCLLKGSSAFYTSPSFCGDGIVGKGERASCEPSDYVEPPPTPKLDPYQVVAGAAQTSFDSTTPAGSISSVKATVDGVDDADAGRAQVHLACNCKNEPPGAQDSYCQNINPPATNVLACADNGCCTPRPSVISVMPTAYNSCRNAEISIIFSEVMNPTTIAQNLLVGYNNGTAPCPDGSVEVSPLAFNGEARPSFWQRLWSGVTSFIRNYVIRPVFGTPPAPPTSGEQAERYCSVQGSISTVLDGPPSMQQSVTYFSVTRALPANKYVRVRLNPGVKSAGGTPIAGTGYTAYFGTGPSICAIDNVNVIPGSILLSTVSDERTVTAHGVSASGQNIVPTLDYNWDWEWVPAPTTSEIVIAPRETNVTQCTLGSTCVAGGGCTCTIGGESCTVSNGESTCTVSALAVTAIADVHVRGGRETDQPSGFTPKNSTSARPIDARAHLITPSGTPVSISSLASAPASGTAIVLLCRTPWPKYQSCVSGSVSVPWSALPGPDCTASTWVPFYDDSTGVEFFYCRDGASAGAESEPLPCLKEAPARVLQPGLGILREYLFTFDTSPACAPAPAIGKWSDDAIGLRIATNTSHQSIRDWYVSRGFRGTPAATVIDGYEALKEGRTAYANSAARLAGGQLYTNVNVLSHSDDAEAETVGIFNQLLSYVNFNGVYNAASSASRAALMNVGICRRGAGRAPDAVRCNVNDDCRVNAAGVPVPGRSAYTCRVADGMCLNGTTEVPYAGIVIPCDTDVQCQVDAQGNGIVGRLGTFKCDVPKSKITRDVRRWADLQALRATLVAKRDATGKYPELAAGTFIRAQTNSTWPSWKDTLSIPLGITLPTDPLNGHGVCDGPNYDRATCWNDRSRLYQCPRDSHVYEYRSVGGVDFQIRNDFEYTNVYPGTDTWSGSTCVERTAIDCNPLNDPNSSCKKTCSEASLNRGSSCLVDGDCPGGACNGPCNYTDGKIFVGGGASPFPSAWCQGTPIGASGVCGDGILSDAEAAAGKCEVGQVRSGACDSNPATAVRAGNYSQVCNQQCEWTNVGKCSTNATNSGASCVIDSDCQGTNARCVKWAGVSAGLQEFRCVGGATNPICPSTAAGGVNCPVGQQCVGACVGGVCGDGVVQNPPEVCDDGALNGTYGHCNATCTGSGFACGDGKKQPSESCDCKDKNGQYAFDGVLATRNSYGLNLGTCNLTSHKCTGDSSVACSIDADCTPIACLTPGTNTPTCAWDCQGPGPRCGDGIVNAEEICDGSFEEFKGYCNDGAKSGCDTNAQCPAGTCNLATLRCTNNTSTVCAVDSDCAGLCGSFCPTPEQKRRRECRPNNPAINGDDSGPSMACTWDDWTCTSPGSCGNGVKETGEECDDGNTTNTDACIIDPSNPGTKRCAGGTNANNVCNTDANCPGSGTCTSKQCVGGSQIGKPCTTSAVCSDGGTCLAVGYMCKTAKCGDGYTNPATGEECDEGVNNGRACLPEYGLTCNYCSGACRVNTLTGAFCGDGLVQDATWNPLPPPDKVEQCDGAIGLTVDWICVGKQQQHRSFGTYFGQAVCSADSCQRGCLSPDADPCLNSPGDNTDNDNCGPGTDDACHGPVLAMGIPEEFFPGSNMTCTSFGGKKRCTALALSFGSEFLTMGMSSILGISNGSLSSLGSSFVIGSFAGLNLANVKLYNICDPDDDNDGVPDVQDCRSDDPFVHPAYHYEWDDDAGHHTVDVPPGVEYCDEIDNDCNGAVDDDWVLQPKPPGGVLNLRGTVVDAFFPDQKNIVGARVIAQRMICSGDKITKCSDNAACGGGNCDSFGKCTHDNARSCTTDYDCGGVKGTCGALGSAKDKESITNSSGAFSLLNIRQPDFTNVNGAPRCGIKLQVDRFVPGSNLSIPFLGSDSMRAELEERSGRGYFTQALPITSSMTGDVYFDGDAGHEERILLIPVPRPGRAVIAFIWSGALPGYMDAELSVPGNDGDGAPVNPNPVYYSAPGTNPDAEPYARLICDADGDGVSCNSFSTSPELMLFKWGGPAGVTDGQSFKFYINDFGNVGGSVWQNINGKKPYVIGGFNNGIGGDPNSVAGGALGPLYAPGGYGKYWHILNWIRCDHGGCGAAWNINWPNHYDSAKPNQTGSPP